MSMSIVHNLAAMNANRMYGIVDKSKRKSAEKLSSGYKINRAADDAAGLTISESMRMKIRGLNQAADNVQDGISYCQVADGALAEVSDMINRIEELAVKSSNGTNTLEDRMAMDAEHQQLIKEMDRIFRSTEFNTLQIWPPQIVPQVSGEPTDYSLYLVQDGNGNEYYGGITYMNHNYSWKDLGIGWDDNTHTFTENREYTIDSKILVSGKDTPPGSGINTVIDDYESRKATAKFTLETKKGGTADTLVKNYSWSADDRGIYIDGVMLTGNGREGNTTWEGMGIIPGYIVPSGIYQFNYFGQTVEFEVPPEMDWGDFVDAFGNNRIDTKWTSKAMWNPSVDVSYIGSGVSTIYIDKDLGGKKENIAEAYSIVANRDSISMENNAGVKEDTINWTKKSDADGSSSFTNTGAAGDGQYTFGSWGNDVNRNSDSKSDIVGMANADNNEGKREIAISEAALYSYKTSLYGATNVGSGIEIHFSLRAGQSEEKILDDLNSSVFENGGIITPVKMESRDTTKKIYVSGSDWDSISFFTQRDILGREYDKIDETISTGNSVKMTASGKYFIELKKGDKTYEMSSGVSADTYEDKLRTTLDTLKSDLFSKHNNQVSNERSRLWKNWCNDSSQNHYATLKNYKVPGEGDDIVTKYAKEKLNIADWNSKTDAEKETQLSSILSSDASARNYFMSELYKCGPCDNIDDTVLGFTLTEKKSMYNTLKDGYPDKYLGDVSEEFGLDIDGRGFAKSYDVKMTGIQNSHESSADTITLTFDTSNIKLSDYLKYDTNFLDYDYNKSLLTPGETMSDLVAIKDLAETTSAKSLLDYEFTNVTFDFKSDGMSYQKVELKHGNNTGTKAINFAQSYSKFELPIQDGTAKGQHIDINYKNMRTTTLGLRGTTLSTEEDSRRMMDIVGIAQETVSSERSQFGAYINRLEHSFNNNKNTAENLQNAESLIRDTDMAKEMVNYTKQNILEQVAQSIMAQANQQTQGVLSILQ